MEPIRHSSTSSLSPPRHSVFSANSHSSIVFLSPLSPLSPISPFSPTSAERAQQDKLEGLQRLARMSRCIGGSAPLELVLPSLVQAGERAIWVKSYLDLYRMALTHDISITPTTKRTSRGTRRRSQSVGNLVSWAETENRNRLSTAENRSATSHTVPMSAASTMLPYLKPLTSADVAADPSLAPYLALPSSRHTTYEPLEDPLQHQQFIAHAKAAILGADAVLMASFRQNFPPRSLEHVLAVCPLPSPPVPSPLAAVRSPRVPYWVKTSFRPRPSTAHPYGHARRRKSRASVWPPATPRTMRRERRQDGEGSGIRI
ncbi:hypothetical protein A0H81_01643 [Grifola frondosa]|uniref:Uncharacterized protein n=1 Tax=Grifola frondosa TaxID=5627 RepID=A0A1C7MK78_GRIFR|nr:hypothetical protein A0H81_01643 [Grifola frondosa]